MGDVDELLTLIKDYWPKFTITKADLLKPTPEVVFRFYSKFIEHCNEKVADLTGIVATPEFIGGDYEPEEQLFIQLSRFLEKMGNWKFFTLADIYQPTFIRTKNFFFVLIHFVAFTECMQSETDVLGSSVFKAKDDIVKLSLEQQNLIDEINENAQRKAELTENKISLEQEHKSTTSAYKEMKALKTSKEKQYTEKRNQIENLKIELENGEYELKRLENVEKNLLEQRVTEREYQNILQNVETLKNELETLDNDDVDIGDGLEQENKVLQHSDECIRILNDLDFSVETLKTLINKEDELKIVSNLVDKLKSTRLIPAKQQKLESEQKLTMLREQLGALRNEYKNVKKDYTNTLNQFSQELGKLKDGFQDEFKRNGQTISDYKKDIAKLDEDLNKMKNAFTTEYVKVSKIEKIVVDKFKETLMKLKEME